MIIQMIRKTVHSRWPDADVEPFGSFGTKLYLPAGYGFLYSLLFRNEKEKSKHTPEDPNYCDFIMLEISI
jgi:hypothetical protein